jgi:hypothetical protein
MITGTYVFPQQSVSDKEKQTKDWQHRCIDAGITSITDKGETSIRKSRFNKLKNYNFWQQRLDKNEMRKVADPFGINPEEMPVDMKHYPLLNSKIDVLGGEELKRRTEWVVRALAPDVVDEKMELRKDLIFKEVMQMVQEDKELEPTKAREKLSKLDDYLKYSLQDEREMKSDRILQWLWRNPEFDFKNQLNRCFYDLMIAAEEIACIDIIGDEPVPRKCNPLNVYTLGQSDLIYVDEADIIVEDGYYAPGWVVDHYYEWLSKEDINRIENKDLDLYQNPVFSVTNWAYPSTVFNNTLIDTEIIEVERQYGNQYGNMQGVYVARVTWKSLRRTGDLKYYDGDGMEQHMEVPEQYVPNKARGEEVEWFIKTEWWEGTRILHDIYVKVRPVPGNRCPYVGIVANVNVNRAMSMIDKAKSLNMLFDIFMYRLELFYATYYGPIIELDLAKKPDDWTEDQWMYYAQVMKFLVIDSFKENQKGIVTGQFAGQYNTTGKVLNPDMGNYITSTQQMLMLIIKNIDDITGVTPARQGNVSNIETVGGTERSVMQSSNNTEYWFNLHSNFTQRFLNRYLAFAQYAWRNKKKRLQYILGDLSTVIDEINGAELEGIDPCVYVTSSPEDQQLLQLIRQAAVDSIKQGTGTMGMLLDTYFSNSMHEISKKLKHVEQERIDREQQNNEVVNKQKDQQLQQEYFLKTEDLRIKEEDSIRKNEVEYAKIAGEMPIGVPEHQIEDPLDREKFEAEKQNNERELEIKQKGLDLKNRQLTDNKELAKQKLAIEERKAKAISKKK